MELKLSLQDQVLFSFLYVEHRAYLVLYKLNYTNPLVLQGLRLKMEIGMYLSL